MPLKIMYLLGLSLCLLVTLVFATLDVLIFVFKMYDEKNKNDNEKEDELKK